MIEKHPVAGFARAGWDDQHLYLAFVVADRDPTTPFSRDTIDPHIFAKASYTRGTSSLSCRAGLQMDDITTILLVGGIICTWLGEWRDLELLERENREINRFRKEIAAAR